MATGEGRVDACRWVRPPGESDGRKGSLRPSPRRAPAGGRAETVPRDATNRPAGRPRRSWTCPRRAAAPAS
ncbi:hypothetical protein [Streptomyces pharetrae]|uniref:hypothetical protein n=1 Tax=Streptomyces pharetrae TaxID=291370 RepID=UPI00296F4484